jgi:hypothetical protein
LPETLPSFIPTTSTTISGAPVNCGTACTITQKGDTLTIADAQLADYPGKDTSQPTPAVALHLNGQQLEVVDSFSPARQIPVRARWTVAACASRAQPAEPR